MAYGSAYLPSSSKPAHWIQIHGGQGLSLSLLPQFSPPEMRVKDHEKDHSAFPHLQPPKQGETDIVKQERFQSDSRKNFLPSRWLKLELCMTLESAVNQDPGHLWLMTTVGP